MAVHLSKNIEFYPEDMSGNHVLNNARAILMSGHSLNNLNLIKNKSLVVLGHDRSPAHLYPFLLLGYYFQK